MTQPPIPPISENEREGGGGGNKWSSKFGTPAFPPISPTVFVWICSQQASKPADWKEESLPPLPLPKMGSKSQGDDFWIPSPLLPLYISYMQRKRGGRGGLESCDNLFSGEQGGRDDAPVFAKCIIHDRGRANNPVSQPYLLTAKSPFFTFFFSKKKGKTKESNWFPLQEGREGENIKDRPPPSSSSARSFRCVSQDPRAKRILCRREGEKEVGSPQEEDPTLLPFPNLHFGEVHISQGMARTFLG